jgi:hypothetical protein
MAIRIAASAAVASMPVTNLSSALRRWAIAFKRALPLARSTLARHFPGSRSKALTTNCLYSMATPPVTHESVAEYGGRWAVLCYNAEPVALNAAAAQCGIAALPSGKTSALPGSHQRRNPPSLRPAEFSPSSARCYEVFFGARVALQPQTTSAIMAARKIPSSTMLILRRPAWGGIRSCAVTPAA